MQLALEILAVSVTTLTKMVTLVVKTAMYLRDPLALTNLRSTTTLDLMKALGHLSPQGATTVRFSSQIFRHPDQSKLQQSVTYKYAEVAGVGRTWGYFGAAAAARRGPWGTGPRWGK